jgi:hypothetical protein
VDSNGRKERQTVLSRPKRPLDRSRANARGRRGPSEQPQQLVAREAGHLEGDKLTGAVIRNDQETKIEDGKFKDGEVTFTVVREINGNEVTFKYKGKVDGDTIKGKTEIDRDGETTTRDWEAKRSKD